MAAEKIRVRNPWDGSTVTETPRRTREDALAAIHAADLAFETTRAMPAYERAAILRRTAESIDADRDSWARTIVRECGKPLKQARGEVARAVLTIRTAAEEATRAGGEILPLDVVPGAEGRLGLWRRFPLGPVVCITPFNFPLNLVAHKVAPAIAAGAPFILKPSSRTPVSAFALGRALREAGAPEGGVHVVPVTAEDASVLVEHPRTRVVSFTGSPAAGEDIRRRAWNKRVVLELGGNAGVVVDASADLDLAAARCAAGGFAQAGQSCVSVQRIFVHRTVHDAFVDKLLAATAAQKVGDPMDPETDVGPLITEADAERVEAWVSEAVAGGARVLAGGRREGSVVQPTVLTGTSPDMRVRSSEIFGPVVVVEAVPDVHAGIAAVDASDYGLQAGIFTRDLGAAMEAWRRIEVGAVLVNEVPTWRADPMPYGGVKASGTGREGPRFAIEDYTEPRLLVLGA